MTIDYDKFWDEIAEEAQKVSVPLQENEMTVAMFSIRSRLLYRSARERLEKLVLDGKLGKRYANLDGHRTAIYYPIQ